MDDPLEYVRRLADCARREEPPSGHVPPAALARLRFVKAPLVRPWSVFAAGALALAAMAAFSLVSNFGGEAQDPILALFSVASINL